MVAQVECERRQSGCDKLEAGTGPPDPQISTRRCIPTFLYDIPSSWSCIPPTVLVQQRAFGEDD